MLLCLRVRIRGTLGDIDPLNKRARNRVKKDPLKEVSLMLPRKTETALFGGRGGWELEARKTLKP